MSILKLDLLFLGFVSRMLKSNLLLSIATFSVTVGAIALPARADTRPATCNYLPYAKLAKMVEMPCWFYQSQGHIVLTWEDGVKSDFMPVKGRSMVYTDQNGGTVYRQLLEEGVQKFVMENGVITVTPN